MSPQLRNLLSPTSIAVLLVLLLSGCALSLPGHDIIEEPGPLTVYVAAPCDLVEQIDGSLIFVKPQGGTLNIVCEEQDYPAPIGGFSQMI